MSHHQLAQLNIAAMKDSLESPLMADFVANLERINALAEESPGFVWRLKDEDGDATAIRPFGENILVNMSVWESVEALHAFVFKSAHVDILRRRREWFERISEAYAVLWWVPRGHRPPVSEAAERIAHLKACGPTARAFTFKDAFPPPDASPQHKTMAFDNVCPAG
ncbi:MAG: DUF3291 domain-containing protein [Betaproteobacteria bacterium]|nr:DUF3291 domain-containing protein [Betaproteobacteria bacterium]